MKTTIDIPESELKDAMRFTGAKTKRAAVLEALSDFNRRRRMAGLVRHSSSFADFPSLQSLRKTEAGRDKLTGAR
jgi:Arc/MetJ family transcription regulator